MIATLVKPVLRVVPRYPLGRRAAGFFEQVAGARLGRAQPGFELAEGKFDGIILYTVVATALGRNLSLLARSHRDYHKLGLAPWAVNTKPPLVIRKLWVSRLVADFQQWHSSLTRHYPEFYLAVWLYKPEFGRSQLVAGIEEK